LISQHFRYAAFFDRPLRVIIIDIKAKPVWKSALAGEWTARVD
jgi:hypothetical protein